MVGDRGECVVRGRNHRLLRGYSFGFGKRAATLKSHHLIINIHSLFFIQPLRCVTARFYYTKLVISSHNLNNNFSLIFSKILLLI